MCKTIQDKYTSDSVVQLPTFINFGSSTRRERHNSYHTMLTTSFNGRNPAVCPNGRNSTIFFHSPLLISQHHSRTPTSHIIVRSQFQLSTIEADNPTVCLHWSKVNSQLTLFQNLQILWTIASGHDVIHTPASFPIWGLLWQLWLSYPLRTSVNCTQCLCTWTKSQIVQSPTKLNHKI